MFNPLWNNAWLLDVSVWQQVTGTDSPATLLQVLNTHFADSFTLPFFFEMS